MVSLPLWPADLARRGVLGMNRRNLDLLARCNSRQDTAVVDNKVLTKQLCEANGIPVPETRAVLRHPRQLSALGSCISSCPEGLVIKPAQGSRGRGILVLEAIGPDGTARCASGRSYGLGELQDHCAEILAGLYSLGGRPDVVLLENRLEVHPFFRSLAFRGMPDIRLIVYLGHPVMAMLRLPTAASAGRANLHQGALGVGLDLADGRMTQAIQRGQRLRHHPDTGAELTGRRIPEWERIRDTAVRLSKVVGLGYIGVDMVLDRQLGVLLLEANARPGLDIQIANGRGLLPLIADVDARQQTQ